MLYQERTCSSGQNIPFQLLGEQSMDLKYAFLKHRTYVCVQEQCY
jgi:hypothetical protein